MNFSTPPANVNHIAPIPTILKDMASVPCPFCGTEVRLRRAAFSWQRPYSLPKPFCANCGWSVRRAQSELYGGKANLRFLKILFFAVTVLFVILCIWHGELFALLPVPLLFGLIAALAASDYRRRKLALDELVASGKTDPSASGHLPIPSPLLRKIQALQRPRRAVLRPAGKLAGLFFAGTLAVLGLVLAFSAMLLSGAAPYREAWPLLAVLITVLAVLAGILVLVTVRERKKLPLLRDGEMATGRIVEQHVVHRGHQIESRITYEFSPPGKPPIRKTERDHTRMTFEDMLIPVFYYPASPNHCTALCATYYRFPDSDS